MKPNSKRREPSLSHFFITSFEGKSPQYNETVFIDPTARLIGDVILESGASIWPMAVLRADSNRIEVGERSVLLDKVLVESPKDHPMIIEKNVLISHGAILHGCIVREGALVGIGAIVLDGAEVGERSIVGVDTLRQRTPGGPSASIHRIVVACLLGIQIVTLPTDSPSAGCVVGRREP